MSDTTAITGLMVIHANQTESLRDVLLAWMRRHPLAPLDTEHLLVQSQGMAQWLRGAMARPWVAGGLGIAAGVQAQLPAQFVWQLYRTVLDGRQQGPHHQPLPAQSPFDRPALLWRLMRLLPELIVLPGFEPLQRFLHNDADGRRRYQLAQRLADLLDQYQMYRADWLAQWALGRDVLTEGRGGAERPLPADAAWQPALWRALRDDVGPELQDSARSSVHQRFVHAVQHWSGPLPAGLPTRLMVFGLSSLPQQTLEALALLARWRVVLVGVQNPCSHHWLDAVSGTAVQRRLAFGVGHRHARRPGQPQPLDEDSLHVSTHPLLAAWGQQGRDFMALLAQHDEPGRYRDHFESQRIDLFTPPYEADQPRRSGMLQQLQDDILDLRPLAETRTRWPTPRPDQDASLRFVMAHSPQREVEVLHDTLLAALDADPSLRLRDVLVMVPDIQRYAPHVRAVFGLHAAGDARHMAFHLADQGWSQIDPLPGVLDRLLDVRQQRLPIAAVLDALELPALRRRFGCEEADLPLLRTWLDAARVCWGLHDAHRQSLGLPAAPDTHTWAFGLRRLLLGYAVGDAGSWQGIEPLNAATGLEAALLGPLARLIDALDALWQQLGGVQSPARWGEILHGVLRDFFEPEGEQSATLDTLARTLDDWLDHCASARLTEPLPLAVVREHWLGQLERMDSPRAFLGGGITFATLLPMRAIPFRHIHLLGMNDGDFPRTRTPADFDLMAHDHRPGDRSRREDDRYLFLEALLSARERLSISWVGRSVVDNSERPPSVLVAQLRDHLAQGWASTPKEGERLLAGLTTVHRLQPFDAAYFTQPRPEQPGVARPLFSYANEWRDGWAKSQPQSAAGVTDTHTPLGSVLPDGVRDEPLSLTELVRWLSSPARAFLGQRLAVHWDEADADPAEFEPFALSGLERWQLEEAMVQALVQAVRGAADEDAGVDVPAVLQSVHARLQRSGAVPPGAFGPLVLDALSQPMQRLMTDWQRACLDHPRALRSVALEVLPDPSPPGLPVVMGDLDGLYTHSLSAHNPEGSAPRALTRRVMQASHLIKKEGTKSSYRIDKVLPHWVAHLAAQVAPALADDRVTTRVFSPVGQITLLPLERQTAQRLWRDLLEAWREGQRRPLPFEPLVSAAWVKAEKGTKGAKSGEESAKTAFNKLLSHSDSAPLRRCWPDFAAFAASGEVGLWAQRLIDPVLDRLPTASGKDESGKDEA